jgi:hypothetical protein
MPRHDTGTADILNNVLRCGVGRTGIIQLRWLGIDLVSGFLRPIRANGCECFCAEVFRGLENSRVGNCPDYPSHRITIDEARRRRSDRGRTGSLR